MSRGLSQITEEALALPEKEQLKLARTLLENSEGFGKIDAEALWEEEIERRIQLINLGLAKGRPFSELLQDVDRKLGR